MSLNIDHVTIAGPSLRLLEEVFADIGLKTDYGGPHSNGITHMALVGFDDGSYVELISTLESGQKSPLWDRHIADDGGACAWAIEVDDVAAEASRVAALGVPVTGPLHLGRQRPDGVVAEWDQAFLGDGPPGSMLPFIIKDRTPRNLRVQQSTSAAGTELVGVATVILGVVDIDRAINLFRHVYNWPMPDATTDVGFAAGLAHFPGTPVTLAVPLRDGDWLSERLARFGESPCAYLIASSNLDATSKRLPLTDRANWFGHDVGWIEPTRIHDIRLGIVASRT